jgi:hypothetical protein
MDRLRLVFHVDHVPGGRALRCFGGGGGGGGGGEGGGADALGAAPAPAPERASSPRFDGLVAAEALGGVGAGEATAAEALGGDGAGEARRVRLRLVYRGGASQQPPAE